MNWQTVVEWMKSKRKWRIFGMILLVIALGGTALSLLFRVAFISDDPQTRMRIAVVAPKGTGAATDLQTGVQIYVDALNRGGGRDGRPLEVALFDEVTDTAGKIAADGRIIGVVGYLQPESLRAAAPQLVAKKLAIVTPLSMPTEASQTVAGVTWLGVDDRDQARFVANYARNIQMRRIMYIVREEGEAFDGQVQAFSDTYQRFETPVVRVWTVSAGPNNAASLQAVKAALQDIDIGAVYVAASPTVAAQVVKLIRETGTALDIVGPASLATNRFNEALTKLSGKSASFQRHGIVAATPVLFDTANEEGQRFQTSYQQKFGASPDWLAATAHDAAKVALSPDPGSVDVDGVLGVLSLVSGSAQVPIQMGSYNGDQMISAPVQLMPIVKGANFNYIEALRNGRVLYVNDRFMFKTSVVYVGITVNAISDLDLQKESALLDLSIWFRYHGDFKPEDLEIPNAETPTTFGPPEESKDSEEVQYRRYRIKQRFGLNFTAAKRLYGQHVAGVTFRHRLLNRNNLMYVVDVLGMPTGKALVDDVTRRRVVQAGTGWAVDNAWVSQDIERERGDGAPQYVGMTGEQPLFSKISMGILLKPASLTARDVIKPDYFFYLAIFGFLGALFAVALDTRQWGRYWVLQSWLLRALFWPMMLLSAGNIALDWAFGNLAQSDTGRFVVVYEGLWLFLVALLVDMAVRRFVWQPLEARTQRIVPNIMKLLASALIYGLAVAAIVAFVFNETLTSLLATSGVLAMVIGLAVQANIANVFSGIILNIERPFKIGDFVKINTTVGTIKDITWRTTLLQSPEGHMIRLANGKVSEASLENLSETPSGVLGEMPIYASIDVDPEVVCAILLKAAQANSVFFNHDPDMAPKTFFKGTLNIHGQWVTEFLVRYRVVGAHKKADAQQEMWSYVRTLFAEQGIALAPVGGMRPVASVDASGSFGSTPK